MNYTKDELISLINNIREERNKYLDKFVAEETKTNKLNKEVEKLELQLERCKEQQKSLLQKYKDYQHFRVYINSIIRNCPLTLEQIKDLKTED